MQKQHLNISELTENTRIEEQTYSLINPQVGLSRQNKPFFKALLRDASGEMPVRKWNFEEQMFSGMVQSGFVSVTGQTQVYNGQVQLVAESLQSVEVSDDQLSILLPTTSKDIPEMYQQVQSLLGSIVHPAMKALADAYLEDEELMSRFRNAPAAVSLHHAYIGGLLEHTLQLMMLADRMLPLYPQLNRDIVMMGFFLHDLGKTVELDWVRGFSYTIEGHLIGHVARGAIVLQVKAAVARKKSGHELPNETLRVLQHIILSHQGKLEHGALKVPATPEAIFIHMLDNLDAKTTMGLSHADRDSCRPGQDFTEMIGALSTRIYRPDPLA